MNVHTFANHFATRLAAHFTPAWGALLALSLCASAASAQTAAPKPPAPAASKPAAKAAAKAVTKPATKTAKKPAPAPVEVAPPEATPEQVDAAGRVYYGAYECEFKQTINIVENLKYPSYVDVKHGKLTYLMKPVLSSTGAIRLEDVMGETLMVQISSKSMLLNVKTAQRLVDDCVSPKQRELIEAARAAKAEAAAAASAASAASAAEAASAPEAAASAASAPTPASSSAAK